MNDIDVASAESPCPVCGREMLVRDCYTIGCEDGQVNQYDSDPLWFVSYEDAWETCDECDGKGYVVWCPACVEKEDANG